MVFILRSLQRCQHASPAKIIANKNCAAARTVVLYTVCLYSCMNERQERESQPMNNRFLMNYHESWLLPRAWGGPGPEREFHPEPARRIGRTTPPFNGAVVRHRPPPVHPIRTINALASDGVFAGSFFFPAKWEKVGIFGNSREISPVFLKKIVQSKPTQ